MTTLFPQLRMWLVVTCALLLIQGLVFWFTPPMHVIYRATDTMFAQVWPYIDQREFENDDPQQGRALRWAPMQGSIRLPQSVHSAPVVVKMTVHTARAPEHLAMRADFTSHTTTSSFLLNPGWRTISLLVLPEPHGAQYAALSYKLTGPILSERRDLGLAVTAVSLTQGDKPQIDVMRYLFVAGLWFWIVPLAMLRRWPVWSVLIPASIVCGTWLVAPHIVAYTVPNQWNLLGYLGLISMTLWLRPHRHALVPFRWSLVLLVMTVALWQFGFGWLGVVLLFATWMVTDPWPATHTPPASAISHRWLVLLIGAAVVMAGILRIAWLNDYPTGLFRDEARHGGLAWRILAGEWMVYSPLANLPAGYFYLSAIPIALFDASAWSIRIVAAVVGTLSVPALFWMVRNPFGTTIALWASVILATLLWHMGLSRIGFPATMGPFLTMIAVGAWLRIPQAKRPFAWAGVAGVATGLMLMVYHSARLMPVVVGFTILLVLWQQQWSWRKFAPVIIVYAIVSLVVASPMVWYALTQPENYMRRIGVTSIMADARVRGLPVWVAVFENLNAYVGMLFVAGDRNPRHFNLGAPQLNGVEAFAFVTGIIWLWWQHRPWLLWLLGWLGVGLVSGVLSVDAPHALRTVESIIPVAIIVAAGAYRISQLLPSRWLPIILIGVVIANGAWSAVQYQSWQTHPRTQSRFDTVATNDVRQIQYLLAQDRPATVSIYVPESLRRSDLGVFLLHNRGVRVWQGDLTALDLSRQHIVLLPSSAPTNWPVPTMQLAVLPDGMHARYQLWCVGDCRDVAWIRWP